MKGMSEREYSAHAGLSRGAVQKAKKYGRLVLYPDGSINAAASDKKYQLTTNPLKAVAKVAGETVAAGPAAPTGSSDPAAYLKARTANEVIKAQRNQMLLARQRGELVERARAEALFFKLARQERDAWVTFPSRVAALVAAEIAAAIEKETGTKVVIDPGVAQRILEDHVRSQLETLAEPAARLGP